MRLRRSILYEIYSLNILRFLLGVNQKKKKTRHIEIELLSNNETTLYSSSLPFSRNLFSIFDKIPNRSSSFSIPTNKPEGTAIDKGYPAPLAHSGRSRLRMAVAWTADGSLADLVEDPPHNPSTRMSNRSRRILGGTGDRPGRFPFFSWCAPRMDRSREKDPAENLLSSGYV